MERVGALLGGNAPAAQGERKNARVVVPVRMRQQRLSQSRERWCWQLSPLTAGWHCTGSLAPAAVT